MKTLIFSISIFLILSLNINAQEASKPITKQIGITGLPIYYFNNGNIDGFSGGALYGNVGFFIGDKNVIGIRPFYGIVDQNFDKVQRLQSFGTNIYYRRYLNRGKLSFFVDGNVGFGQINYSSIISELNESLKELNGLMFNFAIGPGVNYDVFRGWNIEISLQYLEMRNIDHKDKTNIGRTLIPSIGLQKFL